MDGERYIELIDIVNQTIIDYWKSCNGVCGSQSEQVVGWLAFITDKYLTEEQIEEGKDIIGN